MNPGDEVIVFEPFYENYGPDTILADARPVYVPLEPGQPLDLDRLAAGVLAADPRDHRQHAEQPVGPGAHPGRARARSPSSACGTTRWRSPTRSTSTSAIDGEHVPIATLPGMRERTVTISGASQDVQRHRLADRLDRGARGSHRRHPQGARLPHRRRAGAAAGGGRGRARGAGRDVLRRAGRDATGAGATCCTRRWSTPGSAARRRRAPTTSWRTSPGSGAVPAPLDDTAFAVWLSREIGVTPVPGSSFFRDGGGGRSLVRFVFCKTEESSTRRRAGSATHRRAPGPRARARPRARASRAGSSADGRAARALVTGALGRHRPGVLRAARRAGVRPHRGGPRRRAARARSPRSWARATAFGSSRSSADLTRDDGHRPRRRADRGRVRPGRCSSTTPASARWAASRRPRPVPRSRCSGCTSSRPCG